MASYHDYYDSRSRPSRGNEHGSRLAREDSYHRTSTAPRRSDRHSYDDRYSYPPARAPDSDRSHRSRRSPERKRRSWPPAPTVESERTALAKEAGPKRPDQDEAPSRGVIDQEPIMEEVPEMINHLERRFVVTSSGDKQGRKEKGIPTPPTSEDEKARKSRSKRPTTLGLDADELAPEFAKRAASPYGFSKATPARKHPPQTYLSPETITPPQSDSKDKRRARFDSVSQPPSPRRDSARVSYPGSRTSKDYFSTAAGNDNAVADDSDSASSASRRAPRTSRKQQTKQQSDSEQSSSTSVVDFANVPLNAPAVRRTNLDSRRQTDTATSLPKPRGIDKPSIPTPLMTSSAFVGLDRSSKMDSPTTSRSSTLGPPKDDSRSAGRSSRNVSPATSATSRASRASVSPPPQRSPKRVDFSRESSSNTPPSHNSSANVSRSSTPPSTVQMPSYPKMPEDDFDWNSAMSANSARSRGATTSSKVPSRLSTSMRMESMPEVPRSSTFPRHGGGGGGLPYPMDDGPGTPSAYMPAEQGYQWLPPKSATLETPFIQESVTLSRAGSPALSAASRTMTRPSPPSRHSYTNTSPVESRPPPPVVQPRRPEADRKANVNVTPPTRQEVEAMLAKGMPGCPRSNPVAGHDDWYTLVGSPNLDFCPDCIDDVFERTVYRNCFRRSLPRAMSSKVQCAFSTPWIRLAWIITLQQRKPDLTLMRDLADIEETSEPCPGGIESVRSWYGLRDRDGLFVRDFQICYNDVRKIERLLPTLSGLFVRLPHRASYNKHKCALRADGNRFSLYLDKILDIHDKAHATRKGPDPMPFIVLVEKKLRVRECEKDNMLIGSLWHFIPSIPDFTVCEDCYEEIVEPEVKKNSDVAMRFNRTLQPVYGEGIGTSCQLYSRRMRKVFRTAVKENDHKYLARKSKDRRDAELRLQERYRDVLRRAKRLEERGDADEEEEKRLERELERISAEWKDKWE